MTEEGTCALSLAGAGRGRIPVSDPQDRPLVLLEHPVHQECHITFIIDSEIWKGPENLCILTSNFIHVEIEAQIVDVPYQG